MPPDARYLAGCWVSVLEEMRAQVGEGGNLFPKLMSTGTHKKSS